MSLHFKVSESDLVRTNGATREGDNISRRAGETISTKIRVNQPLELQEPSILASAWDSTGSEAGLITVTREGWDIIPRLRLDDYDSGLDIKEIFEEKRVKPVLGEQTETLIYDPRYDTGHDGSTPLDHIQKLSDTVSEKVAGIIPAPIKQLVADLNS